MRLSDEKLIRGSLFDESAKRLPPWLAYEVGQIRKPYRGEHFDAEKLVARVVICKENVLDNLPGFGDFALLKTDVRSLQRTVATGAYRDFKSDERGYPTARYLS